jgi:hypothetical protein
MTALLCYQANQRVALCVHHLAWPLSLSLSLSLIFSSLFFQSYGGHKKQQRRDCSKAMEKILFIFNVEFVLFLFLGDWSTEQDIFACLAILFHSH